MKNLAICGTRVRERHPENATLGSFRMAGVDITAGFIETAPPAFDADADENRERVLVEVRAFSCNYRDRNPILKMATRGPERSFYVIGSEFSGEVLAVGSGVDDLAAGDRVIANGAYPDSGAAGVSPGVPTNHGSRERHVLHRAKLAKIPETMSYEVGAAFQIGAQTAYSMLRKLRIRPGERVLVTAGRSNTSLFVLNVLRRHDVRVWAASTAETAIDALAPLNVMGVVAPPGATTNGRTPATADVARDIGGFDVVVDPFFDLHLSSVVGLMAQGGRYVTCGLQDQHSALLGRTPLPVGTDTRSLLVTALLHNLHIIGNCLGSTEDLRTAIDDHGAGHLDVVIDSVHTGGPVEFLERTFCDADRFGKVVYRYA